MIERQIAQIGTSQYPDAEFVKGMIQANYAHGFIDERQLVDFEDRANEAASTRRLALRGQPWVAGSVPSTCYTGVRSDDHCQRHKRNYRSPASSGHFFGR
ncbi:hypothetical protein F2S73_18495 [Pseudomonas syringae pv. actinidiae]|nr:hypothetical protein [Pseudomonas syringae pv. actinidiae]